MGINTFILVFLICQENIYVLVVDLMHTVRGKCYMNIYIYIIYIYIYIYIHTGIYLRGGGGGVFLEEVSHSS